MYMAFICVHNRRPAFWILAASVLLALIVSVLLLTYPGMKNYTLTIGGEDYIIRSTARLDAEFRAIRYTEDGEPVEAEIYGEKYMHLDNVDDVIAIAEYGQEFTRIRTLSQFADRVARLLKEGISAI